MSASTDLFLDSLALGSQGVLHFIRTDDHFPKEKVCYWSMEAALVLVLPSPFSVSLPGSG